MQEIKKQDYWKSLYEDYKKSNLTQFEYCKRHNLIYYQFGYWKRKFDLDNHSNEEFIEVFHEETNQPIAISNPTSTNCQIEIHIKDISICIKSDSGSILDQLKSLLKL